MWFFFLIRIGYFLIWGFFFQFSDIYICSWVIEDFLDLGILIQGIEDSIKSWDFWKFLDFWKSRDFWKPSDVCNHGDFWKFFENLRISESLGIFRIMWKKAIPDFSVYKLIFLKWIKKFNIQILFLLAAIGKNDSWILITLICY